jgi:hypothetical protein
MYVSSIYQNSDIVLANYSNIDHRQEFNFSATASPVFGIWHPQIELDFRKQLLDTAPHGIDVTLQKPQWDIDMKNTFVFRHQWVLECEYEYSTSYDDCFDRWGKYSELDFNLTKSFLNRQLTVRLGVIDILNTNKSRDFDHYSACYNFQKYTRPNDRGVRLTVSYNFNPTRSKYKGTGAGNEEKKRL